MEDLNTRFINVVTKSTVLDEPRRDSLLRNAEDLSDKQKEGMMKLLLMMEEKKLSMLDENIKDIEELKGKLGVG